MSEVGVQVVGISGNEDCVDVAFGRREKDEKTWRKGNEELPLQTG